MRMLEHKGRVGLAALMAASATPVMAQPPAAIVEAVHSAQAGVEMMDYLVPGRVVKLAPNETLVLGYLKSCWRETIVDGVVTVGTEQSTVSGGRVERTKVACDPQQVALSSGLAKKSGAMAFRRPPGKGETVKPDMTIYGLSPVVQAPAGGRLVIERVDGVGMEKLEFDIKGAPLTRGAFFDLARADKALAAGGVYRASLAGKQVVFKVDTLAQPGGAPLIGRLLRLAPAL
jgi:hypothetical protein